ncbi:hypothetical protein FRC09_006178 [Ceratobasidium sp. 395]|nr:hypothetical protein FRC09_006178 [Ceratobasidium sp. 395]
MASISKKRKVIGDAEFLQGSSLSNQDISDRLCKCPPKDIASALRESVKTATPSELRAVQSLLGPLLEKANDPLHCARCHKKYTEPKNSRSACKIKHAEKPTWSYSMKYEKQKVHIHPCCYREVQTGIRGYFFSVTTPADDYCFVGRHTADPREVDYYDVVFRTGNANISTCDEKGCDLGLSDSDFDSDFELPELPELDDPRDLFDY